VTIRKKKTRLAASRKRSRSRPASATEGRGEGVPERIVVKGDESAVWSGERGGGPAPRLFSPRPGGGRSQKKVSRGAQQGEKRGPRSFAEEIKEKIALPGGQARVSGRILNLLKEEESLPAIGKKGRNLFGMR